MDRASKRSKVDIYADILEVLKRRTNSKITRISYAVGLPVDRAKRFLGDLSSYGLANIQGRDETFYSITHRGLEFLDSYRKLASFLSFLDEKADRDAAQQESMPGVK